MTGPAPEVPTVLQEAENAVVDARLQTRALILEAEPMLQDLRQTITFAMQLLDSLDAYDPTTQDDDHHA